MLSIFKRLFTKSTVNTISHLPKDENIKFVLKVDNIEVGELLCESGEWKFNYTEEFKKHTSKYNRITGFSDLNKIYHNDTLWPFFQTRIPGLKQPAVKEILKSENIDEENEVELLKRFGKKTISNPYELEIV